MNGLDLLRSMEYIDDAFVEEANKPFAREEKRIKKSFWMPIASAAAVFILCIITVAITNIIPDSEKDTAATIGEMAESASLSGEPEAAVAVMQGVQEDAVIEESAVADYPAMIMVKGILYYDSGEINTEGKCGVMDGEITSQAEYPTEDNQSNFGTGFGYQLGNGTVDVYIDGQWHIFIPYKSTED